MLSQNCNCSSATRQQLMDTINHSSFAVDDMLLYLDTHPEDQEALAYYQQQARTRTAAMKEYARLYGPLTKDLAKDNCSNSWQWMLQPWPWEVKKKGRC